jgi:hypothetical protein
MGIRGGAQVGLKVSEHAEHLACGVIQWRERSVVPIAEDVRPECLGSNRAFAIVPAEPADREWL